MANNKKKRENYFQQNINRYGSNFLDIIPLDRIKLDTVRVFRELARGSIDIDEYGKYFTNTRFLEACIETAATKYNLHYISAMGVERLIAENVQGYNIGVVYEYHCNAANAYRLINLKLSELRTYNDTSVLTDLVANLGRYRYHI